MTAILQATARLGTRLLRQHGESIELGLAGRRIPALTLAARFSLAPEQAWERVWRSRLHLVGWGLAVTLLLVARALTGHVLFPLDQIRAGLIQILAGTFSQRLGLGRRDELGEVADAFDHMATGLQERVELGRFVSGTLEASLQEGGQPDLTPRVVRTVVLASDIRGFTSLSEANPPAAIVHLLEAHLEAMSRVIADHGGLVDKFIGDAVVAVFLADDELAAATRALAAARQMMAAHAELCRQRTAAGLFGYAIGVGIAVGEALVGSFGAAGRAEFTVLGAPRDEAEHLEALSKEGRHTRIVLSPQVATLLAEVPIFVIGQGEGLEVMAE